MAADKLGPNSKAGIQDAHPFPTVSDPGSLAKPYHAKVRTLFERIMKQDMGAYSELFRPDAERVIWMGPDAGKVGKPSQAIPFEKRKGGPIKYYNRVQYFGDHCWCETHTAVSEENDPAVHPKLKGTATDVLVCCKLDDEGFITRFEEFADTRFVQKGKRPIPPAPGLTRFTPPEEVRVYNAPQGDDAKMLEMGKEWFTKVMERKDLGHLFTRDGQMMRFFEDEKGAFEGKALPIGWNRKGGLYVGPPPGSKPDMDQYTNRRWYSGNGWAVEMHTVNVRTNKKHPDRKYGMELGILFQVDHKGSGKFQQLLEWADPPSMKQTNKSKM